MKNEELSKIEEEFEEDSYEFRRKYIDLINDFNIAVKAFRAYYYRDPLDLEELKFFLIYKCSYENFLDIIIQTFTHELHN